MQFLIVFLQWMCPFWLGLSHSLFLVNAWPLEKGRFSSIDICFTGKSDGFSLLPFLKKCLRAVVCECRDVGKLSRHLGLLGERPALQLFWRITSSPSHPSNNAFQCCSSRCSSRADTRLLFPSLSFHRRMGLLIVLFLALGHHFVLGLSSSTSGNSRTCLESPESRRQSGCVCCGSWWSSCPWRSWQLKQLDRQAGQCQSELCRPTGGRRAKKGSGGNTTAEGISRALVHKAEGHYIAVFDARTCALQEDINWMAHSSMVGLGVPKSCSRLPFPTQPSLSGSSFSLGSRLSAARALLQLTSWGGAW